MENAHLNIYQQGKDYANQQNQHLKKKFFQSVVLVFRLENLSFVSRKQNFLKL